MSENFMESLHLGLNKPSVLPTWYLNKPSVDLNGLEWGCPFCKNTNSEEQKFLNVATSVQCNRCGQLFKLNKDKTLNSDRNLST